MTTQNLNNAEKLSLTLNCLVGAKSPDRKDLFSMELFRRKSIPSAYTNLDFICVAPSGCIDGPVDSSRIEFFRACKEGRACISEYDTGNDWVVVKMDFPEGALSGGEYTEKPLSYYMYYWRPKDADCVTQDSNRRPGESVSLETAGISKSYIESIAEPDSPESLDSDVFSGFVI